MRRRCSATVLDSRSTGQLHKGGPNTGVFILMLPLPQQDIPIRRSVSFGTLGSLRRSAFASLDGWPPCVRPFAVSDPQWIDRLCELLLDEGATIEESRSDQDNALSRDRTPEAGQSGRSSRPSTKRLGEDRSQE